MSSYKLPRWPHGLFSDTVGSNAYAGKIEKVRRFDSVLARQELGSFKKRGGANSSAVRAARHKNEWRFFAVHFIVGSLAALPTISFVEKKDIWFHLRRTFSFSPLFFSSLRPASIYGSHRDHYCGFKFNG